MSLSRSLLFAVVVLGLLAVSVQGQLRNRMVFVDNYNGFSATLPGPLAGGSTADPTIYTNVGFFTFSVDWNGDQADTVNFALQQNTANGGNTGNITVVANTVAANTGPCRTGNTAASGAVGVPGTSVTLNTSVPICNYTVNFINFRGQLTITISNGTTSETINIYFTTAVVVGDPQFIGLRGQSYQVHGIDGAVYNLISESNTQVNSRFVFLTEGECPAVNSVGCWSHPGSYMGEMSFQSVVDGKLHAALVTAGDAKKGFSAVQMDGKALKVGESASFGAFSLTYTSTHGAVVTLDNYNVELSNSDMFLNLALTAKVPLSQLKSHGLIGQTHSTKTYKNTVKYVEGEVDDYIITDDDVFGTSFPFNQFGQE